MRYPDDVPVLETERLLLRAPSREDWPAYRALMTSPRGEGLGRPHTESRAFRDFALEIGHWVHFGDGPWKVCRKDTGESVGLVGPWHPVGWPENEIGWMTWKGAEGRGYAFEAAAAARAYAYGTLGWDTAVSYIGPDNARSRKLAERLGAVIDPDATELDPGTLTHRHPSPEALGIRESAA
ncbi:MAG: GNAT family N-acetyltransferase [Pseudomonadota bacterium]